MATEPDIPSYFLCPISLQIMSDPVTLSTGITYNRCSIERWLTTSPSCPVTNQSLTHDADLTPNHTLRRLIQSWCTVNAVDRLPTPRPPVDKAHIAQIIQDPHMSRPAIIHKLNSIVSASERNRLCVASSDAAVDYLASSVDDHSHEALAVLDSLRLSDHELVGLFTRNEGLVDSLSRVLDHAITLLRSIIFAVDSPDRLAAVDETIFAEIVRLLRNGKISCHDKKTGIEALMGLCRWGRNRIKAVHAGAVHVLIEILLASEQQERRVSEMSLAVLEKLSVCAEGRAEIVSHAAGIAVVGKKVMRVSSAGSDRAVKILHAIARYSATRAVVEEMAQVGVVNKLCTVLMVECCGAKAKERAREVLRMHARVWSKSPCLSPHLLSSFYP